MLPLFTKNGFVLEGFLTTCSFDYINRDLETRLIQIVLFVCGFCVPFFVFVLFYTLAYKALKTKGNVFRNTFKSARKSSGMESPVPEAIELMSNSTYKTHMILQECQKNTDNKTRFISSLLVREKKLARTITLIFVCFCVAWMPYAAITLLAQFGSHSERYITPWTTSIPSLLAKFSSVYNPIIYFLTYPNCKTFYKQLFRRLLTKSRLSNVR